MKNKCFEDYLYDQHAKQYTGTDDLMPDDWGEWVSELDSDQLIKFADAWMKDELSTLLKASEGMEKALEYCATPYMQRITPFADIEERIFTATKALADFRALKEIK